MCKITVLLFFIIFTIGLFPRDTYYLSYSTGSDLSDGKTAHTAWKTIARLNSAVLHPGDSVLLKRNDVWREELVVSNSGTSSAPIYYNTYGSGDKPVISGASLIKNFVLYSGTIYTCPIALEPLLVTYNNRILEYSESVSSENSWRWDSGTLYVNAGEDPDNGLLEASQRNYCINCTQKNYILISNLYLEKASYCGLLLDGCSNCMIDSLTVNFIGNGNHLCRGIYCGSDNYSTSTGGSSITKCVIKNVCGDGIFIQRTKSIVISDNFIYTVYAGKDGEDGDNIQLLDCTDITIRNNWMTQQNSTTIKGNIVAEGLPDINANFIIERNTCLYGNFGIGIYQADNTLIRYNFTAYHDNTIKGSPIAGINALTSAYKDISVYYNISYMDKSGISFGSMHEKTNVRIFNNTIVNPSFRGLITDYFDGLIANNIIWGTSTDFLYKTGVKPGGNLVSDRNIIGPEKDSFVQNNSIGKTGIAVYSSLKAFSSATQYDLESMASDPLFVSISQMDFRLQKHSPAVNAGMAHTISQDYYGKSIKDAPDIGASEFQESFLLVNCRIFLQGAFSGTQMNTSLTDALPLSQPYDSSPWNYHGTELITNRQNNAVDWILLELRKTTSPASAAGRRAALLRSDGIITDTDFSAGVMFEDIQPDNYYIVVFHRNHLAIMSPAAVFISSSTPLFDFSSSAGNTYGETAAVLLPNGSYALIAGDCNSDGVINDTDLQCVKQNIFRPGYKNSDLDMNGVVNVKDYRFITSNHLRHTNVP